MNRSMQPFSINIMLAFFTSLAGLALISLSLFITFFSSNSIDHVQVYLGLRTLAPEELMLFESRILISYAIVSIYLIGHAIMWLGYAHVIGKINRLFSYTIAALGLLEVLFDMSEYCMRLALLAMVKNNFYNNHLLVGFWICIRHLSVWLIFLNICVIAIAMAHTRYNILIACFALSGLFIIPVMYALGLAKIWYIWLILWHFVFAIVLYNEIDIDASGGGKL